MNALPSYLTAAMHFLADPWKVGSVIGAAYMLVAICMLDVRGTAPSVRGFRTLTPPPGGWMLAMLGMIFFPIMGGVSIFLLIVLLKQLLGGHVLAKSEWAQALVFTLSLPLYISCTISFFRWCAIRRRYDDTGIEWGIFKYSHRIEWADIVNWRAGEYRGLELRLRNGLKLKMPVYLNGLSELTQMIENRMSAKPT